MGPVRRSAIPASLVLLLLCLIAAATRATAGATCPGVRATSPGLQGIRIVDLVDLTDPKSEARHEYAGELTTEGVIAGRRWRASAAWFRYAVRIYDDSALTLVCVFRGSEGRREVFDVLVDDRVAATRTFESPNADRVEVALAVPETLTIGKTVVTVTFRAKPGSVTAGLMELRTVQEHLERTAPAESR